LSECNEKFIFSKGLKNILVSNFMEIYKFEAELFHADGRSDRQIDK